VRSLGDLLEALDGRLATPGWHNYLKSLLADPLGLNLRNVIAHGLRGRSVAKTSRCSCTPSAAGGSFARESRRLVTDEVRVAPGGACGSVCGVVVHRCPAPALGYGPFPLSDPAPTRCGCAGVRKRQGPERSGVEQRWKSGEWRGTDTGQQGGETTRREGEGEREGEAEKDLEW
jgi:hypothetical protein